MCLRVPVSVRACLPAGRPVSHIRSLRRYQPCLRSPILSPHDFRRLRGQVESLHTLREQLKEQEILVSVKEDQLAASRAEGEFAHTL